MSGGVPAWARPGAKVVCVDGQWYWDVTGERAPIGPRTNEICTVSDVAWHQYRPEWGVRLVEHPGFKFDGRMFRPLTDRPNDAERFTARLFEGFDGVGADDPSPRVMPREPEEVPFG